MTNDGGPAFPVPGSMNTYPSPGMSLRDHFAVEAMKHLTPDWRCIGRRDVTLIAEFSYLIADAMLAEREKK